MTGLFYKDLKMCKQEYILLFFVQLVMAIGIIGFCIKSGTGLNEESVNMLTILKISFFFIDLFGVSTINTPIMTKDEQKNWNVFINSVPNGKKAQVRSKYISVLFMYIVVVSCLFIIDAITVAICNNTMISVAGNIVVLLCAMLIYDAIQLPFIVGLGANQGQRIKGLFVLVLFGLFFIYGLFGDISFLMGDDAAKRIAEMIKFVQSGYFFAFMPYGTALFYWLSYRIALLVYNKEGGRYDE